jgi:hypothetical protein
MFLAGAVGAGLSLLIADSLSPERKIGLCLLVSACIDIASAEGLAWIAEVFLQKLQRRSRREQVDTDPDA